MTSMGNRELASFPAFLHLCSRNKLAELLHCAALSSWSCPCGALSHSGEAVVDAVAVAAAAASKRACAVIRKGDEPPSVCSERASASSLASRSQVAPSLVLCF